MIIILSLPEISQVILAYIPTTIRLPKIPLLLSSIRQPKHQTNGISVFCIRLGGGEAGTLRAENVFSFFFLGLGEVFDAPEGKWEMGISSASARPLMRLGEFKREMGEGCGLEKRSK
jgi:hypothetical protein